MRSTKRGVPEFCPRATSIGKQWRARPEVEHSDVAIRPDDDIRWLQVPVHDATFVRSIERIGNLDSDMPRFVDRKRAVREPCLERRTLDHLHDDDLIRADPFESINGRDVRVIERGEYLRFTRKSRDAIRVSGKAVRQDFERNVTTELRVASPIHRSHSALADRRGDLVDADAGAWNEGHGRDYRVPPAL